MKVLIVLFSCLLAFASCTPAFDSEDTRIVGGQDAYAGQFPYQVSLRQYNSHFCGGSILSSTRVLSAAHCNFGLTGFTVVAGTTGLTSTPYVYQATEFKSHEYYDASTLANDVAIIKIKGSIQFNNLIQAIALPTFSISAGTRAMASGWGYTSYPGSAPQTLQYLQVNVINSASCTASQICSLNKAGEGVCSGDSGGPLALDGQLHGVASAAHLCALGLPDYWTRVYSFNSWIRGNM